MNDGIEGCFEPTLFIKQCSSNVWNFVQVAQSYAINLLITTRVSLLPQLILTCYTCSSLKYQ